MGAKAQCQCILGFRVETMVFKAPDRRINQFCLTVFPTIGKLCNPLGKINPLMLNIQLSWPGQPIQNR
jgi:hypothetical protein